MDLIEKLGGRKFLLTLICIGVGTAVELKTDRGVTASFAGLLAALVAAFGAANAYLTANMSTGGSEAVAETSGQISTGAIANAFNVLEDKVDKKIEEIGHRVDQATATSTQVAEAFLGVTQQLDTVRKLAATAIKVNV